jgi:hypothetical protein
LVGAKAELDKIVNDLENTILSGYNVSIKKSANW